MKVFFIFKTIPTIKYTVISQFICTHIFENILFYMKYINLPGWLVDSNNL